MAEATGNIIPPLHSSVCLSSLLPGYLSACLPAVCPSVRTSFIRPFFFPQSHFNQSSFHNSTRMLPRDSNYTAIPWQLKLGFTQWWHHGGFTKPTWLRCSNLADSLSVAVCLLQTDVKSGRSPSTAANTAPQLWTQSGVFLLLPAESYDDLILKIASQVWHHLSASLNIQY